MVANELLMQFQADILDVPVVRPTIQETTALGAAYAASMAVGYWENEDGLRANWQEENRWQPDLDIAARQKMYAGWLDAVERTYDLAPS